MEPQALIAHFRNALPVSTNPTYRDIALAIASAIRNALSLDALCCTAAVHDDLSFLVVYHTPGGASIVMLDVYDNSADWWRRADNADLGAELRALVNEARKALLAATMTSEFGAATPGRVVQSKGVRANARRHRN